MRISSIPQLYRNLNRSREIVAIMSKYGLAGWLSRFDSLPGKSLFKNRNGQVLADENGETRIRLAMEELGPTFIKLGQILSTRPDVVGVELANELQKLQTCVPADSLTQVSSVFEAELGKPIAECFAEFSPVAEASASIGQVHRGRLHSGIDVAVKVQHPSIKQRMRIDLEILTGLAQLAEKLPELQPYRPTQIVAEFQRLLRRELDFTCERRHLDFFVRAFKDSETVKIPYSHPDLSSERVLVMEWLDGVPLSDHDGVRATGIDLARVARSGAEVYLEMIFRHGVYHADPHPGNLLLMPDGKIGLLDFGMVVRMDDKTREDIEELLLAIVEQDASRLCAVVMRVGDVPPGLDETNLSLDLADFVAHYSQQSIDKFELGSALSEMIDIMLQYKIVLPSAMTLLLKVLIMLEGTAKKLEPSFCLMEVIQPYQSKIMARRLSPARQWRKARKFAYELQQLAEVLPRRMRDILQQVQSGRFDVHLDHRGLEPSVNRLVLGMLTSALFLGSTMMVTYNVWPIWNVSVPGTMGFALSGLLGLRLLWAINKSGKLDRRK
jgi:ubiquinone biosynthesis protein